MVQSPGRPRRYLAGGLALLAAWTVVAAALLAGERLPSTGPLSLHRPQVESPTRDRLLAKCFPRRSGDARYKVVGGPVGGRVLYACYELDGDDVLSALVVEEDGFPVQDPAAVKRGGAWPWVGAIGTGGDLLWAVLQAAVLLAAVGALYRWVRRRWLRRAALAVAGLAVANAVAVLLDWRADPLAVAGAVLGPAAFAYGIAAGRRWLAPPEPVAPALRPEAAATAGNGAGEHPPAQLTRRERDVLRQLAAGRSNAEIAGALFVSEATVKSHVARLLAKLELNNRVQLALFAHRHGLGGEDD